jgi:hypothetical protein
MKKIFSMGRLCGILCLAEVIVVNILCELEGKWSDFSANECVTWFGDNFYD